MYVVFESNWPRHSDRIDDVSATQMSKMKKTKRSMIIKWLQPLEYLATDNTYYSLL